MGCKQLLIVSIIHLKINKLYIKLMLIHSQLKMVSQFQNEFKESYTAINRLSLSSFYF